MLVISKVTVTYRLEGDYTEEQRETIERAHGFHAQYCPVARSISPCIEIETRLTYAE